MANKDYETAKGAVREYDGGKYQLRVDYKVTKSSIKFRPYVVLARSFKSKHTATFTWLYRTKEGAKAKNGGFSSKEEQYEKKIDIHYSLNSQTSLNNDIKYYPEYQVRTKKKVKTDAKTKKKGKTVKVKASLPVGKGTKGKWFINYDPVIRIGVKVGGDAKQLVSFNELGAPAAPGSVDVIMVTSKATVIPNDIKSSAFAPIKRITLRRKVDSPSESSSWSDIYSINFPDVYGSGGDIDGINLKGTTNLVKFEDLSISDGHRYQYAVQTSNTKDGTERTNQTANNYWWYSKPTGVSSISHERIGDSDDKKNRIFFTRDRALILKEIIKGYVIQYSNSFPSENTAGYNMWQDIPIDSNNIGNIEALLNQNINDVSITHNTCKKDTPYSYRIKTFNYSRGDTASTQQISADWAPGYTGTAITYNEPYEPEKVEGVFDDVKNVINLSITRKQVRTTADKMFIQRKVDDGEWTDVGSTDGIDINPNIKVAYTTLDKYTYEDNVSSLDGDIIKYRVSLGCTKTPAAGTYFSIGNGKSPWKESPEIELLRKPNPPTLVLPINGSTVTDEDPHIRFGWIHSPRDGTQQTQARLMYRVKGTSVWQTIPIVGANAYYDMSPSSFKVNDVIEWKAATKGKHKDFSDDSKIFTVKIIGWPKITWRTPVSGSTVSMLPMDLSWIYEDPSGTCKELTLTIYEGENEEYSVQLPTNISSYKFADYLFDDDERYRIELSGLSTTGLGRSSSVYVEIHYIPIIFTNGYMAMGTFDEESGYVYCAISKEDGSNTVVIDGATEAESKEIDDLVDRTDPEPEPIVVDSPVKKAILYRRYRGNKTRLHTFEDLNTQTNIENIQSLDRYAPINREFEYVLLQQATTGEVGIVPTPLKFRSLWWYVYHGEGYIARAKYDPTGSMSLSRPEKQQVRYSGRTYPVSYDSSAINETYSLNFTIVDDEYDEEEGWDRINEFRDLIEDSGGHGVWKSFEGDVYLADFEFNYSSDYTDSIRKWNCSLSVTRIDDDETGFDYNSGIIDYRSSQ